MIYKIISFIKNNKMFKDFGFNILASVILNIAAQIIAYPYVSKLTTISEFGTVLLIMGIVNVIGVSLGNSLNNTRILMQSEYENENNKGDFNIIFLILSFITIILMFIVSFFLYDGFTNNLVYVVVISSLVLFRAYYSVDFRINLNYKRVLNTSLFTFLGYIIGVLTAHFTQMWIMVFLFGELFACIYILLNAKLIRESFKVTNLFGEIFKKYIYILLAAILSSLMMYMDRFLLSSFLELKYVSIFMVATFLGKTASVIIGPIASVLLSYYVKVEGLTFQTFYKRFIIYIMLVIFVFLGITIFGESVIQILYPSIFEYAITYFNLANIGVMVYILGNLIQPTVLSYCHIKWNLIIQISHTFIYIIASIYSIMNYGLIGFCYAIILANIIRALLMVCVIFSTIKVRSK